jgi:signal peptidase I
VFTARIPNPGVTRGGLAFGLVNGRLRRLPARLGWAFPRRAAAFPVQAGVDSLAAATFLFLLVFRPFPISTGAMEDTLLIGDYVLVRVVLSPSRGDLVLFRYPVDPRQVFVKRVVATGGDRLRIKDKRLFVNGVPPNEPYALHKTSYIEPFRDNFPSEPDVTLPDLQSNMAGDELMVPPGKLFVMGDNRDSSLDSRYWGFLDPKSIIGKPVLTYFSAEPPAQAPMNPRPVLLHPSGIRWRRMLKVL